VQADAKLAAACIVQTQVKQGLARVVVGLAAGDDAEAVVRAFDHVVVQAVGADVRQCGIPLVVEQARFLLQRRIRPADVHTAGGHLEVGRDFDLHTLRINHRGGAGLDNFLNRLHAGPDAGKTAHGKGVHTQVQNFLHVGRKKYRQAAGLEDVIALMRSGGAFGHMVITGYRNHAAPSGCARHVGVFEHVGATVHARPFAVPDAENAIEFVGAGRRKTQLLGAPDCGGRQLLIDARLEHDVLRFEVVSRFPKGLVVTTQRRTAVATDKSCRVFALQGIALTLQHGQLDEGLHPAHESLTVVERILVVQSDCFQGLANVFGQWGVHL